MSDKTINLHPFHVESEADRDGFCLQFLAATDGGKRVKVRLHMPFYFVRFIARDLWKAVTRRQSEVDEAKKALAANGT